MIYEKFQPLDNNTAQKIEAFGNLGNQIDLLKAQLNELKTKYSTIEDELRPILLELQKTENKHLKTENYLVSIKRMGYDRTTLKYKAAFTSALTKVNAQTRKVLEKLLDQTASTNRIVSSIGVVKLKESVISKMIAKIMSVFKRFINPLKKTNKSLDELNKLLNVMTR